MCSTPAPPSTALVAASIWSGVGEVKTSPGQAASSIPMPTNPPCIGSCPEPPPDTMPTFPWTGASARTMNGGSKFPRTRSPCGAAVPSRASRRTSSGALISFFMPRDSAGPGPVEDQRADDAADERADHRDRGIAPIRRALARDWQDRVHDPRAEVTRRVDRVPRRSAERQPDSEDQEADEEAA